MKLIDLQRRLLRESFEDISVQKLGIEDVVNKADQSLGGEAARAIDSFVGMPHDAKKIGMEFGIMYSRDLEDAYGLDPTPKGVLIRQEIEKAFAPVRAALMSKFGPSIRLYRGQHQVTDPKDRSTLSWTSDPRIAAWFAGVQPHEMRMKPITDTEVQKAESTYHSTGRLKWRSNTYVRTQNKTNDPNHDEYYYDIFDRDNEYVTDGDDISQQLKDDQQWYADMIAKRDMKLKRVLSRDIPIDDIIWITDRAGQSEFILHNRRGKIGYVDIRGELASAVGKNLQR